MLPSHIAQRQLSSRCLLTSNWAILMQAHTQASHSLSSAGPVSVYFQRRYLKWTQRWREFSHLTEQNGEWLSPSNLSSLPSIYWLSCALRGNYALALFQSEFLYSKIYSWKSLYFLRMISFDLLMTHFQNCWLANFLLWWPWKMRYHFHLNVWTISRTSDHSQCADS